MDTFIIIVLVVVAVILLRSIRQVDEYERGVKFRFGKYKKIVEPGWRLVLPIIESMKKIDVRTKAVDVPEQDAITKDNVSIRINAVLYYSIFDAAKVIISVENYKFAVGAVTLDELLAQRDRISEEICKIIDEATDPWGIKVENVELKDISLPEEMKRVLAIAAEAEREKAAVITKAEGEAMAAKNLAKAAETMTSTPGALHLRTLSTLSDISADKSNTIVVALPIEVLEAIKGKDKDKK